MTTPIARHQVEWPNRLTYRLVLVLLRLLPGITSRRDSNRALRQMARVCRGEAVALMIGDCAQPFHGLVGLWRYVRDRTRFINEMAAVLEEATGKPVVRILRFLQVFKPRSSSHEQAGDRRVLTFRGPAVNSEDPNRRTPQAWRLLAAYIQGLLGWWMIKSQWRPGRVILTAREMLELGVERAWTRRRCNRSTCIGWLGARTNGPGEAHMDYAAGTRGAIAVKIGPGNTPADITRIIHRLSRDIEGRLTLIFRLGIDHIYSLLPDMLEAVKATGKPVVLMIDNVHGNGTVTSRGFKTRQFDDILKETLAFIQIVRSLGLIFGGIHSEAAPDVRQVLGGPSEVSDAEIRRNPLVDALMDGPQTADILEQAA